MVAAGSHLPGPEAALDCFFFLTQCCPKGAGHSIGRRSSGGLCNEVRRRPCSRCSRGRPVAERLRSHSWWRCLFQSTGKGSRAEGWAWAAAQTWGHAFWRTAQQRRRHSPCTGGNSASGRAGGVSAALSGTAQATADDPSRTTVPSRQLAGDGRIAR